MKVALFITCFNDTLFPHVGIATTHLLERLGLRVYFPEAQTCCGQMHYNTGYQREAIPLLRHFVEVFRDADVIVAPSASCVGMVRDLYPKAAALSGERTLIEAVEQLIPRVYELSEFLVKHLPKFKPDDAAAAKVKPAPAWNFVDEVVSPSVLMILSRRK